MTTEYPKLKTTSQIDSLTRDNKKLAMMTALTTRQQSWVKHLEPFWRHVRTFDLDMQ